MRKITKVNHITLKKKKKKKRVNTSLSRYLLQSPLCRDYGQAMAIGLSDQQRVGQRADADSVEVGAEKRRYRLIQSNFGGTNGIESFQGASPGGAQNVHAGATMIVGQF